MKHIRTKNTPTTFKRRQSSPTQLKGVDSYTVLSDPNLGDVCDKPQLHLAQVVTDKIVNKNILHFLLLKAFLLKMQLD